MPEAIKVLKKQEWNGNIRELKNFVESILVLEKGQRISPDMVEIHLNISKSEKKNTSLPVLSYHSNDKNLFFSIFDNLTNKSIQYTFKN